jgi:Skp family chaperone for outer membrane proteins
MKIALASVAVGALVTAVVAGQAPATRPSLPVGYVNIQRAIAESAAGKAELARVQTLQQRRASELRTRQQTLEGLRSQLAQASESAARVKLQQQEFQQRTDLERATVQAQQELQNLQRKVVSDFQSRVRGIVEELVKGQGLQLVLNGEQAVIWSAPGADLTNSVIERLEVQSKAAPAKP